MYTVHLGALGVSDTEKGHNRAVGVAIVTPLVSDYKILYNQRFHEMMFIVLKKLPSRIRKDG